MLRFNPPEQTSLVGCKIADIPTTPALLLDLSKTKRNCEKMRKTCSDLGIQLRSQTKTHKTLEVAVLQTGGSKRCLVCSTLIECEFYAQNGFDDILYGFPFTSNKLNRCVSLAKTIKTFHLMVDSKIAVQCLLDNPVSKEVQWSVFVALDCGYGREGIPWDQDEAVEVVQMLTSSSATTFAGLYVHCGNSYVLPRDDEQMQRVERDTVKRILHVRDRLRNEGIECPVVGTGSTPTCARPVPEIGSLTEMHPGNYVFYDAQQMAIGSCSEEDIAVKVATRVVGHKPSLNQLLIDCGWEGLSLDGKDCLPSGYALVQGEPNLKLIKMTQEVGKLVPIQGNMDFDKYPIGTMLFLYPFHSCATTTMHPTYWVTEGDCIIDKYKPVRGW